MILVRAGVAPENSLWGARSARAVPPRGGTERRPHTLNGGLTKQEDV